MIIDFCHPESNEEKRCYSVFFIESLCDNLETVIENIRVSIASCLSSKCYSMKLVPAGTLAVIGLLLLLFIQGSLLVTDHMSEIIANVDDLCTHAVVVNECVALALLWPSIRLLYLGSIAVVSLPNWVVCLCLLVCKY